MKSWYTKSTLYHLERGAEAEENNLRAILAGTEDTPELISFFASLNLLQGVPTEYLICDETLLPPETLRFFYIDESWVDCLMDGALSMGRTCSFDRDHDDLLRPDIINCARKAAAHARSRRLSLAVEARPGASDQSSSRTGFFLRSDLVRGWPGLQIACYCEDSHERRMLECLRLEQIGEDTLFCIVDGVVNRLELTEPEEGLSFGFIRDETGELVLTLTPLPKPGIDGVPTAVRGLTGNLKDFLAVPVPFRQGKAPGVVDLEALTDAIGESLSLSEEERERFSALEMAVELLRTPVRYSVKGELL